jgi:hypothetical protein
MRFYKASILFLLISFFWQCSVPKTAIVIVSEKDNALNSSAIGEYQQAVQSWQAYFNLLNQRQQTAETDDYIRAASDAYKADNIQQTFEWYELARMDGYEGVEMHLFFMSYFRQHNNLSRELTSLHFLTENHPGIAEENMVSPRLFDIYMEIDRERALDQWYKLDTSVRTQEKYLNSFFTLNKSIENNLRSDSIAIELLKINPQHIPALEWLAEKYYFIAEEHYQREMTKYNNNKTMVQYQFLLNALKVIGQEFVKSRDYFDRLWALDKKPRYASFLANIHARLDNRQKAEYYKKYVD